MKYSNKLFGLLFSSVLLLSTSPPDTALASTKELRKSEQVNTSVVTPRELAQFINNGVQGKAKFVNEIVHFEYNPDGSYGPRYRWSNLGNADYNYSTEINILSKNENIYKILIEAEHQEAPGVFDNGIINILIQHTKAFINLDSAINPTTLTVGREEDGYEGGGGSYTWVIKKDGAIISSGNNNQPDLNILTDGDYTIEVTATELYPTEFAEQGSVSHVSSQNFSIKTTSTVVVNHYLENATTPFESNTLEGKIGSPYESKPSSNIPKGYILVGMPPNVLGDFTPEQTIVDYYYKLIETTLTVVYVDSKGNTLHTSVSEKGSFGEDYSTSSVEIAGYTLVKKPSNANGQYGDKPTEVKYVYKLIPPTIDSVQTTDSKITGTGTPNYQVQITLPDGSKKIVDIDQNGKWTLNIPDGLIIKKDDIFSALTIDPKLGEKTTYSEMVSTKVIEEEIQDGDGGNDGDEAGNSNNGNTSKPDQGNQKDNDSPSLILNNGSIKNTPNLAKNINSSGNLGQLPKTGVSSSINTLLLIGFALILSASTLLMRRRKNT